jgi:hypothetical protein
MTLIEYKNISIRSVNTSEAYSRVFFIGNNNAVIPYINVGLMPENPINGETSFVEYSYYMFGDISSVIFNAAEIIHLESRADTVPLFEEYVILDGIKKSNGAEVKILCNELSFYVPIISRTSKQPNTFIPIETPKYKRNMDSGSVDNFFSKESLPQIVRNILGDFFYMFFLE